MATAGATAAAGWAITERLMPSATTPRASGRRVPTGSGILVLVTLYGGNDGLNTVVPYENSAYYAARPLLAIPAEQVLPLDEGFGLHPNLKGFKQLWDQRNLAIVRGVGYRNPSFSHFQSMDIWQSGVAESSVDSGWLGRWLDATGVDPMRALSVGPILPLALSGNRTMGAVITPAALNVRGSAAQQAAFTRLQTPYPAEPRLAAQTAQSGRDMLRVREDILALLGPDAAQELTLLNGGGTRPADKGKPNSSTTSAQAYGGGALQGQLEIISRLIKSGSPTRVYQVGLEGFDTHTDEAQTQASLLGQVDQAVSTFVSGLRSNPHGESTVALIYTEFGRRVAANASGGTDHGSANAVFLVGPRVKGGFYGEQPSVTKLEEGNLIFTTDFRSIYSTLLERVIGEDPKVSLGKDYRRIAFI